jgi:flavin reductase (DIM6/NTAB) family NADH-FMN oxidoreductase RutF
MLSKVDEQIAEILGIRGVNVQSPKLGHEGLSGPVWGLDAACLPTIEEGPEAHATSGRPPGRPQLLLRQGRETRHKRSTGLTADPKTSMDLPGSNSGRAYGAKRITVNVATNAAPSDKVILMPDSHFYEPRLGHRLPHDPFKAIVAPRPIGWVSTLDSRGRVNLAPYSFFNAFCDTPPIVGFSSSGRKDSQRNVEATGEFVANLATIRHAAQMNLTSADVSPGVDEMALAGLTAAPCRVVKPPRVADAPAALECKVLTVLPLKDLEGRPTPNTLILGQVVGVHIDPAYLKDGLFHLPTVRPIARCGYRGDYAEVTSLFEMLRPVGPVEGASGGGGG